MVGEFPELQGLMGRKYAALQGETDSVAAAIEDHYKPAGPSDRVPKDRVAVAVALADKLDTLVGFWSIDEKPTGSKDPYALRRAALGVIRLILENGIKLSLLRDGYQAAADGLHNYGTSASEAAPREIAEPDVDAEAENLLAFFADRLKVYLRDKGARHDLIDAVFALPGQDDLLMVVRRVEALGRSWRPTTARISSPATSAPPTSCASRRRRTGEPTRPSRTRPWPRVASPRSGRWPKPCRRPARRPRPPSRRRIFAGAMQALSTLRAPVDAFFERVTVNAEDPALRANRLALLNALRAATREVADFSRIEG